MTETKYEPKPTEMPGSFIAPKPEDNEEDLDYISLNALLNMPDDNGDIQFDKDKTATRAFFLNHVNPNTVFFHTLKEKLEYLVKNGYYDVETLNMYHFDDVKDVFTHAYDHKYRFPNFLSAYKFYAQYALRHHRDKTKYLERYEDRVSMVALFLAKGDPDEALDLVEDMITHRFQPATPTFLNAGRANSGELVSCFLLRSEDSMESIAQTVTNALQLSKRGGGVGINLTNLREEGSAIKNIAGAASGVVPVMKILEDVFTYANQLGQRQGAGAVYISCHHPDILKVLDTKRENADEKIRIKTLSLGVVASDMLFQLAKANKDMYQFSPYDVEKFYGKPMSDMCISDHYDEMIENPDIHKTKVSARKLLQTIASLQFESGYPYLLFEDTANEFHNVGNMGRINMSNLCVTGDTQILTDSGYFPIGELYKTRRSFDVVCDNRAISMRLDTNGTAATFSTPVAKTAEDADTWKVTTKNGQSITATAWHKFYRVKSGELEKVKLDELEVGDELLIQGGPSALYGESDGDDRRSDAYKIGVFAGNSMFINNLIKLSDKKKIPKKQQGEGFSDQFTKKGYDTDVLPQWVKSGTKEMLREYVRGALRLWNPQEKPKLYSRSMNFLQDIQMILLEFGIQSQIKFFPDYKEYVGGDKVWYVFSTITDTDTKKLAELLSKDYENEDFDDEPQRFSSTISTIAYAGKHDVYDVTVDYGHSVIFNGIVTGNCSEIVQYNTPTKYHDHTGEMEEIGSDISCNLASMNIGAMMESEDFSGAIRRAVRALTMVSDSTDIAVCPQVKKGNDESHSIGLGAMNLHGFLGSNKIMYGSEESLDFVNVFFATQRFWALKESCRIAQKRGASFVGFDGSDYNKTTDDGYSVALHNYTSGKWETIPHTDKVAELFDKVGNPYPDRYDWQQLDEEIRKNGLYHAYLLATAPTGSISYIANATSSIHPITSLIETRKEAMIGRAYYPAPGLRNDNRKYYPDAYTLGYKPIIDVYAVAEKHIDQSASLTLFFTSEDTTRDVNKAYIYAWSKKLAKNDNGELALYDPEVSWKNGIVKSLYYSRVRTKNISGTEVAGVGVPAEECESCVI